MIKLETITFDGQHIQSPEAISIPDPNDILSSTTAKGTPIDQQPDGSFYIRITRFDLDNTSVQNPSTKRELGHGSLYGSATMIRRQIRIEGELIAKDREGQLRGRDALQKIFRLSDRPSVLRRSFYRLAFERSDNREWFTFAQVQGRLVSFRDDRWQSHLTPFTINLVSEDPRIFSEEIFIENIQEGNIGGWSTGPLENTPAIMQWDEVIQSESFTYPGMYYAPSRITVRTLTGADYPLGVNPRILSLTSGFSVRANTMIGPGDEIVFDGFTSTLTVNNTVSNNLLETGSLYPQIVQGTNELILVDDTTPLYYDRGIEADIEYREVIV